jgi:hypothetical protein
MTPTRIILLAILLTIASASGFLLRGGNEIRYQGLEIAGDNNFIERTIEALWLVREKDPLGYAQLRQYLGRIEQGRRTGVRPYTHPPRYEVGDQTARSDPIWYASTLIHEAAHARLYHDYREQYRTTAVPDGVWRGETAERVALRAQYRTLKKLGAPASYLRHLRNASSTEYWNLPASW